MKFGSDFSHQQLRRLSFRSRRAALDLNQREISPGFVAGEWRNSPTVAAAQDLGDCVLMRIAHYPRHARERRDFLRCALGVAARDQYFARRVGSMDAPDDLPDLRVGAGGNRARVQDGDLAFLDALGFLEARSEQPRLESRPVRLACPATEIEKMKRFHRRNPF